MNNIEAQTILAMLKLELKKSLKNNKCNDKDECNDKIKAIELALDALFLNEQYKWELNVAIEQLKELGYELGQKINKEDVEEDK